jgi:hypothetical protein
MVQHAMMGYVNSPAPVFLVSVVNSVKSTMMTASISARMEPRVRTESMTISVAVSQDLVARIVKSMTMIV